MQIFSRAYVSADTADAAGRLAAGLIEAADGRQADFLAVHGVSAA